MKKVCTDKAIDMLQTMPEFKADIDLPAYSMGGFGCANFASVYHSEAALVCDRVCSHVTRDTFVHLAHSLGFDAGELIPDRFMMRNIKRKNSVVCEVVEGVDQNTAPTAEQFHTDNTQFAQSSQEVYFGGFLNLSNTNNKTLTVVKRSHKVSSDLKGGDFHLVAGKRKNDTDADKRSRATTIAGLKKQTEEVIVHPGEMAVFFENITHTVTPGPKFKEVFGKFFGFRLTSTHFFEGALPKQWCGHANGHDAMTEQRALHHKGGVLAPLYAQMHMACFPDKMTHFSTFLNPQLVMTYTYSPTAKKQPGKQFQGPLRFPLSLTALGHKFVPDAELQSLLASYDVPGYPTTENYAVNRFQPFMMPVPPADPLARAQREALPTSLEHDSAVAIGGGKRLRVEPPELEYTHPSAEGRDSLIQNCGGSPTAESDCPLASDGVVGVRTACGSWHCTDCFVKVCDQLAHRTKIWADRYPHLLPGGTSLSARDSEENEEEDEDFTE